MTSGNAQSLPGSFSGDDAHRQSFTYSSPGSDAYSSFAQGKLVADVPLVWIYNTSEKITVISSRAASSSLNTLSGVKVPASYVMLLSQTCDICGEGSRSRPLVNIAPVYDAYSRYESEQSAIRANKYQYFIPLTAPMFSAANTLWVADLRFDTAIEKGVLLGKSAIDGFASDAEHINALRKIGRIRMRLAISKALGELLIGTFANFLRTSPQASSIIDIFAREKAEPTQAPFISILILVRSDSEADIRSFQQALNAWLVANIPFKPPLVLTIDVKTDATFLYSEAMSYLVVTERVFPSP